MKSKLRSIFLRVLLSRRRQHVGRALAEWRRRLLRRPHAVHVFIELDDPYSYLLTHFLPAFERSFDVDLRIHLAEAMGGEFRPRPDMLAEYAVVDCQRLAHEFGVPFLDRGTSPPVEHRRALLGHLAANPDDTLDAIAQYWRGDSEAIARKATGVADSAADAMLRRNSRLLARLGHYNCATIHYAGEWFWGVDRLHYLLDRLTQLGARRDERVDPKLASIRQVMQVNLPVTPPGAAGTLPPLELFLSFRSPYSYLVLRRAFAIADAFGLELIIRPVLPMVMRGMQVPRKKLLHIVRDAGREAERLAIPFGELADPVGAATERSLAVFYYAQQEKRERDFVASLGEAIWSQAVDVATDDGMRKVAESTGLFWPEVVQAMRDDSWRGKTAANRESMMESGSWGVPTMRVGDFIVWGQDRDWLLVRHLEELCDTGDGILV